MTLLSQAAFTRIMRQGELYWSETEERALVHYLGVHGLVPHTDPDAVTDPCDRADLASLHLLLEVGSPLENLSGWNEFCLSHPGWVDISGQHDRVCQGRHAVIGEMMRGIMPAARAVGRRRLDAILATDPVRGARMFEAMGPMFLDAEDKGE